LNAFGKFCQSQKLSSEGKELSAWKTLMVSKEVKVGARGQTLIISKEVKVRARTLVS
jgi:hypothetical protein